MFPRLPPRREPRVLAIGRSPTGLVYAIADPWELRAAGSARCNDVSLGPALFRIVRREKPTLLVTENASTQDQVLFKSVTRIALRLGVAVVTQVLPKLPRGIARDLYPELPMRTPTRELTRVAALAVSAVLYADAPVPSRHYAHRTTSRRHSPNERAA